ncbi:MAG: hypothetical protein ACLPXZ_09845 [Mycobacterium sp.]
MSEHKLINNLAHAATAEDLGGKLSYAIAERTLISRTEASRLSKRPPIWGRGAR